jgi:hypothetical protein
MRLVTRKNGSSPSMTTQRASTPAPRASLTSGPSISATPPPLAVLLTFQIVTPSSASRPRAASSTTAAAASSGSTSAQRSGGIGSISTSLSTLLALPQPAIPHV